MKSSTVGKPERASQNRVITLAHYQPISSLLYSISRADDFDTTPG